MRRFILCLLIGFGAAMAQDSIEMQAAKSMLREYVNEYRAAQTTGASERKLRYILSKIDAQKIVVRLLKGE